MFVVYILKSLKNGKRYVGSTSKDAQQRLREHNYGSNKWTKQNKPFKLIYTEQYQTIQEVRKREHFLKSGQGRKWFDKNLLNGGA